MPSLIIPILGDSNAGSGQSWLSSDDVTDSALWMFDNSTIGGTPAIVLCKESILDANNGSKGNISIGPNSVGSTMALCKLLIERGKLPIGYDKIIIAGEAWSGTAFPNYWAVTGSRYALDGNGSTVKGFFPTVEAALALDPANRIWFYDWVFGANCGGDASFQSEAIAMFSEIRSTLRSGASAPILTTGTPPDRVAQTSSLTAIAASQASCATWLNNSIYVDPTGLQSQIGSSGNIFVHFSAASHRGGVDNSPTTNPSYSSGTWYWDASVTYAASNYVIGSDQYAYVSVGGNNIGIDPTTDAGAHWTKTTWQYGSTVSNPLSERKYSAIVSTPAFYQFAGTW